ncbi:hypothetical protein WR25_22722 [Diploscapter pachys]|uniref:Synaphin protein n=1 Tax=Diploscapter pachys TaxID=2018661 RepID=A0A2A2KV62_9BILA|nr:hypothetical protein WR25_22722 [Diploscapter pachys]
MAGFLMKQMVGNQLNEVTGSLGMGGDNNGEKTEGGEDPEVEREKMRQNVRDKYNIKKKEDQGIEFTEGRIGSSRKTPEELAAAMNQEDDSIIGQLGLTEQVDKAKAMATGAFESIKGFLPFGK